jgi:hypothetical protein
MKRIPVEIDQPIACSLEAAEAASQLGEWHDLLAPAVVEVERVGSTTARFRLAPEFAAVPALIELARREVACCPFFRFALEVDVSGSAFAVSVPDDAAAILDAFTALVTP